MTDFIQQGKRFALRALAHSRIRALNDLVFDMVKWRYGGFVDIFKGYIPCWRTESLLRANPPEIIHC